MKVIASIASYNTAALLKKCVKSIFEKTKGINFGVWVFDNDSKDNSTEEIRKNFPNARIIENKKNIGFGKAHNAVFESTESEYFAIINSDIEFKSNVLKTLSEFLDSHNNAAAVSCKLFNQDNSLQENISVFPTIAREIIARLPFFQNPYAAKKDYSKVQEVESFNGACFMVRRKAIQKKLFEEEYFAYAEETDLFYQLKKAGWKIFFDPKATAIHFGGASSEKIEAHEMHLKGLKIFFKKNRGNSQATAFLLVCLAFSLFGFAVATLFFNNKKSGFCKRIIKVCWKEIL